MNNKYHRAPNLVCVCVDSEDFTGRLYMRNEGQPTQFSGVKDLLVVMEGLFNELNHPQAYFRIRTFRNHHQTSKVVNNLDQIPENDITSERGKKATFIVHVESRQNATWQGSVLWAEKNIDRSFRSALELIKLLDSAMENDN